MKKSVSSMRRTIDAYLAFHGLGSDTPYMVTAGAALYVWGLRETYSDIDIIVPALPEEHSAMDVYGQEIEGGNLAGWRNIPNFDIDAEWKDRRFVDGIWVMSLAGILRFKVALNRPKDQADIRQLLRILRYV